jgi:hypothetical protein
VGVSCFGASDNTQFHRYPRKPSESIVRYSGIIICKSKTGKFRGIKRTTRTKAPLRGRAREMTLFLLKSQGVNISRSDVANQQRRVFRIEAEPASCRPSGVESVQIDNALLNAV